MAPQNASHHGHGAARVPAPGNKPPAKRKTAVKIGLPRTVYVFQVGLAHARSAADPDRIGFSLKIARVAAQEIRDAAFGGRPVAGQLQALAKPQHRATSTIDKSPRANKICAWAIRRALT